MKQTKITKLLFCAAALMLTGQAYAHTGVRDAVNASATATAASYNGFTLTHGCGGDTGQSYPVLGQAAVFPTGDRVVWREADGTVIAHGAAPAFWIPSCSIIPAHLYRMQVLTGR